MSMQIKKTVFFVNRKWFYYGQGDDIVGCFADAIDNVDDVGSLSREYPRAFDLECAIITTSEIVDTEQYCVCYDDANDYGQKAFFTDGLQTKEKLLNLYHKGLVSAAWIFPMSKAIKTKELEKEIRNNPKSYNKVAEWIDEENW